MAQVDESLRALKALLDPEHDGDPFPALFESFRGLIAFDQAVILEGNGEDLRCVGALPPALADRPWTPRSLLEDGAISPTQPALSLPIRVRRRRGVLIMLREVGQAKFDEADIAMAQRLAGLASQASSDADAQPTKAEVDRLLRQVDELTVRERAARQNGELLEGIVGLLPVGLTVQDEDGRLILVNDAAAARLNVSVDGSIDRPPADPPAEGELIDVEERLDGPVGERTWLTSRKSVRVLEQRLLLSTSLDITARKQIETELARRAYSDDLTGLANRAMLQEYVESVLQSKGGSEHFALAFIDLDNFKHINDYYSHAIGDALLVKVARRIADIVRGTDMLARISGDEFVLLVDPVESEEHIYSAIEGLLEKLKQPFYIEGFEVFTSASIGVSVYPEHGGNYEELRRNADNAMYRAKSGAKGAAAFFDRKMGESVTARMELEQRLRLAIRDRQFSCAFQPKVDIRSQEVVGFETLIRWLDEETEIQPPSAFIGLATELGLIDPITHFVLEEAIRSIDVLDEAFGPGKTIAINVAAKQAGDLKFMRSFAETLKASGCAERFIVEVTEDAFIAKNQFQMQVLPMLRDIGVRVSIDDFGTGYSSLSVLADITADEIKIDRSFITAIHQRPRSQSILKAIESVSFALGMSVVAEGVETFEELAYLQGATRIRYAQGFHFAKPFFLDDTAKTSGVAGDERAVQAGREPAENRGAADTRAPARLSVR
jgi:c-di-GMP phosphodiesterase Gmr